MEIAHQLPNQVNYAIFDFYFVSSHLIKLKNPSPLTIPILWFLDQESQIQFKFEFNKSKFFKLISDLEGYYLKKLGHIMVIQNIKSNTEINENKKQQEIEDEFSSMQKELILFIKKIIPEVKIGTFTRDLDEISDLIKKSRGRPQGTPTKTIKDITLRIINALSIKPMNQRELRRYVGAKNIYVQIITDELKKEKLIKKRTKRKWNLDKSLLNDVILKKIIISIFQKMNY